jgi:hypothetical protein
MIVWSHQRQASSLIAALISITSMPMRGVSEYDGACEGRISHFSFSRCASSPLFKHVSPPIMPVHIYNSLLVDRQTPFCDQYDLLMSTVPALHNDVDDERQFEMRSDHGKVFAASGSRARRFPRLLTRAAVGKAVPSPISASSAQTRLQAPRDCSHPPTIIEPSRKGNMGQYCS